MKSRENPNVKAFLTMIKKAEHGTDSNEVYYTLFGGGKFRDTSKHPNVCVKFRDTCSTASGAYQILYTTYLELAAELNLWDFSEETQDLMAIRILLKKRALIDIEQGRVQDAINKVKKVWASFPGAGYGQPEKDMITLITYYTAAGGKFTA